MLADISLRRLLLILISFCLLSRLAFILIKPQTPVMWDARIYSSAAIGLIYYAQEGGEFGHPERCQADDSAFQRTQFDNYLARYIKGEQIEWLYYDRPTISQAQDYIFISGPILPLYLAAVFWQNIMPDFLMVRILNALIDSLSLLLLFLIADDLFGRRAALLAGIMYIIYLPFILLTGLISPDSLTIALILATFYSLLLYYRSGKIRNLYIVGLLLGALTLAKPTATLLFLPFLAGFLWDYRKSSGQGIRLTFRAAIPFLVVTIPWLLVASVYYNRPAFRDPDYSEANFRSSSSIKYEGYDLDYAEKDFWIYPVSYTISKDPIGYAKLLAKKFARLWSKPYNDFRQSFIITPSMARAIHLAIALSALFGVFHFALGGKQGHICLLLIPIYYSLLHVVFHSLARYNLNPMPLLIIASAGVMERAYNYIRGINTSSEGIGKAIILGVLVVSGALLAFMPVGFFIKFFGQGAGEVAQAIAVALIFAAALFFAARLAAPGKRGLKVIAVGVPLSVILVITIAGNIYSDDRYEWHTPLTRPDQAAGVKIYIPRSFKLADVESAGIKIDLLGVKGAPNKFKIAINGAPSVFAVGQPPISSHYYRKMTYKVFELMMNIGKEEMRHWSHFQLSAAAFNEMVQKDGYIDIRISSVDSTFSQPPILIFGNYEVCGKDTALIPDLAHSSIERFIDKGDPRVPVKYPLSSDSAISYLIENASGDEKKAADLSPMMGAQVGRFRIYIEIDRYDKTIVYF
jgi:hypothetical protein